MSRNCPDSAHGCPFAGNLGTIALNSNSKTMKRLSLLFFFVAAVFTSTCQNLISEATTYVCPPCDNNCDKLKHEKPGVCKHCSMPLIKKGSQKTIAFYLQDGVEVLDFAGPMEVFAYAGYRVFTVSKSSDPIKSQGILNIIPDYNIDSAPPADILAFFGGNATSASADKKVIKWVRQQENIQYHFSVCTGAFILAEAGVLDEKTATTFHSALDDLESNYPAIDVRKDVRFVDNGNVITTAGISAGIDGALHLVAKLQGLSTAKRTAYYMEYDNWVPGDGLILSDDNPYSIRISEKPLSNYSGKYEFKDKGELELIVIDGELNAVITGTNYPLFLEGEDIFSDIDGAPVFFKRNAQDKVIGYTIENDGKVFKKLK